MVIQAEEENERLALENKQQRDVIAAKEEALTAASVQMSEMSNEIELTFARKDGVVMVNATEMAKPFGKSCSDWLRTEQSKRMINAISTSKKCDVADLLRVTNGGNTGNGTWMHEDVALVFAQWLSPTFYIWCNDRIKELLTIGMTATQLRGVRP